MAHTICIANQKGGVGKTTTAVNLAASLAISEKRTLIVDCDPQGNATTGLGIDKTANKGNLYHGMLGESDLGSILADTEIEYLKAIPSNIELIGFEVEMMSHDGRELALKNLLSKAFDMFEYIILDCPPSLSLLTVNALTASNYLLVPLQCEFYALEGLGQLLQTVKHIKRSLNPELKIAGILLTMYDKRTNLSVQVAEDAAKYFKNLIFKTIVPRNVRLGEAPSFGKPIMLYDAASIGAKSYISLAQEIMNMAGDGFSSSAD
ncbi:MAG: AAA family ATPase [Proteobacteria bacterium]|nr:AAA family ATPase [Pseudomonadota bacterium]